MCWMRLNRRGFWSYGGRDENGHPHSRFGGIRVRGMRLTDKRGVYRTVRLGLAYEYDPFFSLSIARVDPLPHQLDAVYGYFLRLPRIRFLLADDAGAGKTIMAGLTHKELKARGLVKRVLIVAPANLTFQWQRELADKFREKFEIIRGATLRANYGQNAQEDRFGRLGREYARIVFDKELLKADSTVEWVTPGHPLFEAVRTDVLQRVDDDLRRGAVFYDLHRSEPAVLDVFAASVKDGRANTIHRRLFGVETSATGQMALREPTYFHAITPAPTGTEGPSSDFPLPGRQTVEQFLYEHVLQSWGEGAANERAAQIERVARHVKVSLNALIDRQNLQLAEYCNRQVEGQTVPGLNGLIAQAEGHLDDLNNRLETRCRELELECHCAVSDINHLGRAWVVPHPERASPQLAPMIRDDEIEHIAIREAIKHEEARGWVVESVETENRGFDLISRRPHLEDPKTLVEVRFNNSNTRIEDPKFDGTVKRGSATCPSCGYTTSVTRIREQFRKRLGGANDARLMCVVVTRSDERGRFYRLPNERDFEIIRASRKEIDKRTKLHKGVQSLSPDEPLPPAGGLGFRVQPYGITKWADLFTGRQLLALTTLTRLVGTISERVQSEGGTSHFALATVSLLALAVSRSSDHLNSGCGWNPSAQKIQHLFARQALPIVWDFAEANPFGGSVGDWGSMLANVESGCNAAVADVACGIAAQAPAQCHPLPNDAAELLVTDPPYYDAVPYSDLANFFYVWLRRCLPSLGTTPLTPKTEECIMDVANGKTATHYQATMKSALAEARRVIAPSGAGVVVFAHKSTSGWEAQLQAMVDAGWIVTGSWPIDTELETHLRAMDSAALASSVHLVCRPRKTPDGSVRTDDVGDWRQVLAELPRRIHEWMPRLASEGIVGADAIFACLGPALEVFSRYSRVEKASGEVVMLKEYLEQVWAAVSTEALSMIFKDADAAGLEPDARLTAMWLWTLGGGGNGNGSAANDETESDEEEEASGSSKAGGAGFTLEYDAARKIAQGLGVNLEQIASVVEIKGNKARLCSVAERTKHLFGKDEAGPAAKRRKKKVAQMSLFEDLEEAEAVEGGWSQMQGPPLGATVLDRVHQAMILFAAGRSEAIKRFLVEDGAGTDARFWKLAQSLSALYPKESDEKRWVDGVLARKKGWGF